MVLCSCNSNTEKGRNVLDESGIREHMTNARKIIVRNESRDIDDFIHRHNLNLEKSGTGLRFRYIRSKKKGGAPPENGSIVSLTRKLYLLDGTFCYSADENKPLEFRMGEDTEPAGMEEALYLMNPGDSAVLVIPSHLAYGMPGDGNKIPGAMPLYCLIKLLKVK